MVIISQDKTMILNFENIETIEIGNPLENNDGKFKILCDTTSDNQYTIAGYEKEERAKEVLQEIINKYKITLYNSRTNETVVNVPKVYEMPTK